MTGSAADQDPVSPDDVRRFALALPETTEEPHFDMTSFRVRGKIFATVPADDEHLHIFVGDEEIQAAVAELPRACEPLLWGQRVRGLRVTLARAPRDRVRELLAEAWRRKAPARLRASLDRASLDRASPDLASLDRASLDRASPDLASPDGNDPEPRDEGR